MNHRTHQHPVTRAFAFLLLAAIPFGLQAQVPVDDDGTIIGSYAEDATGAEDIPLLSRAELEELVGPVALYPDDLLAIVLPASAYPLQIVEAARFLEALENDPSLEPDPEWDDSVVALLNYPEVVTLLNEDIDWTWRLGEAVVAQQADVVGAVEAFRDRAYAAGNLKSDDYQKVTRDQGVIEIAPASDDIIYVPYYEPERVVVYQPRPVYYYYPRAYPVYYYPYPAAYDFDRGFFWGVTTAFTIGWLSDSLHVYHHSYHGHPYYRHTYWDHWWYRRPSITVYNTTYVRNHNITINRYYRGDDWRPRRDRHRYVGDTRITRSRHITRQRDGLRGDTTRVRNVTTDRRVQREAIRFRERPVRPDLATTNARRDAAAGTSRRTSREQQVRQPVARRESRERDSRRQVVRRETPQRDTRQQVARRDATRQDTRRQATRRDATQRDTRRQVVRREPAQRESRRQVVRSDTAERRVQRQAPRQRDTAPARQRATPERRTTERRDSRSDGARKETRRPASREESRKAQRSNPSRDDSRRRQARR